MSSLITSYTPAYKESVFALWYSSNKPSAAKLSGMVPDDESGRKPAASLISKWMEDGDWYVRADILDERASESLEKVLVTDRVEIFKKQAEIGKKLQEIGMRYIESDDFKLNAITALKMVVEGAQLEKESVGLTIALTKIYSLGDSDIQSEIKKLLAKADKEDVVEGDVEELGEDGSNGT